MERVFSRFKEFIPSDNIQPEVLCIFVAGIEWRALSICLMRHRLHLEWQCKRLPSLTLASEQGLHSEVAGVTDILRPELVDGIEASVLGNILQSDIGCHSI